jgi:phage/conjugal plasmid C-4 type zinc finger TraR family protein
MDDADRAGIELERIEKAFLAKRTQATPSRPSATQCIECDIVIPEKRRQFLPGVQLCVECRTLMERRQ